MELKEMILHYRDTGQRVDEVLYQEVIKHIEQAQELEEVLSTPKLNLWSGVQNERLRANRLREENKRYSETIEEVRSYMEQDSIIMMSDEDRFKGINKALIKHYEAIGGNEK